MKSYLSNLTDSQWNTILHQDKRKRKHTLRDIFDALFYLLKTGCQWRMLPIHFPSWKLVYYYFSKWKADGTIALIQELLRDKTRKDAGKHKSPSIGIIVWIVERTFAWFESYRRLSKDFEYHTDTSQTMIQLAMIKLVLNSIK